MNSGVQEGQALGPCTEQHQQQRDITPIHPEEQLQQVQQLLNWVLQGPSDRQPQQVQQLPLSQHVAAIQSVTAGSVASVPYAGSLLNQRRYAASVASVASSCHYPRSLLSQRDCTRSVVSMSQVQRKGSRNNTESKTPVKAVLQPEEPKKSANSSTESPPNRAVKIKAAKKPAHMWFCGLSAINRCYMQPAAAAAARVAPAAAAAAGAVPAADMNAADWWRDLLVYSQTTAAETTTSSSSVAVASQSNTDWCYAAGRSGVASTAAGQPKVDSNMQQQQQQQQQWRQQQHSSRSGSTAGQRRQVMPSSDGLTAARWKSLRTDNGRINDMQWLLQLVQQGGVAAEIRPQVWPLLLGLVKPDDTDNTAATKFNAVRTEYEMVLAKVEERLTADLSTAEMAVDWAKWSEICDGVEVDSVRSSWDGPLFKGDTKAAAQARLERILLVRALAHPKIGYVQGMADLAVPFLYVYESDAEAYAMFSCLMAKMQGCFAEGMPVLVHQLRQMHWLLQYTDRKLAKHLDKLGADSILAAFQMLLLQFRRELEWQDSLRFWEVLWAYQLETQCSLAPYVAAAVFIAERSSLLSLQSTDAVMTWAHSLILDPIPAAAAGYHLWRTVMERLQQQKHKASVVSNTKQPGKMLLAGRRNKH